jgi:hypothetical protein
MIIMKKRFQKILFDFSAGLEKENLKQMANLDLPKSESYDTFGKD